MEGVHTPHPPSTPTQTTITCKDDNTTMMDPRLLVLSLVVVLIALFAGLFLDTSDNEGTVDTSFAPQVEKKQPRHYENALYVIGDLHGDAGCARYWVERTGLVRFDQGNQKDQWVWTDKSSSLVFLGDYIDKGPTSRQTVEFVKALTTRFPQHVTALMGNHEMELLRDREQLQRWGNNADFFQLPYASVHPAEYLNFITNPGEIDDRVVEALYNASLEVYGFGQYRTMISPSIPTERSILSFVAPDLRQIVRERLIVYQKTYLKAFASGTDLGTWIEQRPIIHLHNETMLFVHGGISPNVASLLNSLGVNGVSQINSLLKANVQEGKLNRFLDETVEGNAIYDMLVYRGNLKEGACMEFKHRILPSLGASMVGVGHTPSSSVRILCGGRLLALDSALGRWFRNSGNEYCRGEKEQVSSNGRFRCNRINQQCQGEIVRITGSGGVDVIG